MTTALTPKSNANWKDWPLVARQKYLRELRQLPTPLTKSTWRQFARLEQLPPAGNWRVWLQLGGRGVGKTRTGAEWCAEQVQHGRKRIALIAPIAADTRDVMIEGESGIMAVCTGEVKGPGGQPVGKPHPAGIPVFEPSKRRLTWPNGAMAFTYSGEEPERLRGPQHDAAWCDEIAAWKYATQTWDMMLFGLRLGNDPRIVATTTPRPIELLIGNREKNRLGLINEPTTVITRGRTVDNIDNLAPQFYADIVGKYQGTRLGRQELDGELLEDVPGALWQRSMLDDKRVKEAPDLTRVVVAIDPAMTSGENADETGIVVAGKGADGDWYVLADYTCRLTPDGWAHRAITAYTDHRADRIVAEVNNGGELVEHTLRTIAPDIPYKALHASRGKRVRAEPIAALYEQGRVHHAGLFSSLEDQMCTFTADEPIGSPDRVDALVWALTELLDPFKFIMV